MKVLIVEDDQTTRKFYEEVSRNLGLEPISFSDAESAWAVCEKESFPILILDWLLPGMSGLDLCHKIRGLPDGKWSFILVATVKNKALDLRSVLDAGADDYIAKPLDVGLMRIRLEIAKTNANKLLEKRLAEQQLQSLRYQVFLAEKLVSVRGMVSGVSHELNNPLQGILGLSELMAVDMKDNRMKNDVETIRQLAEQCKTIVHDLLIFSDGGEATTSKLAIHEVINWFLFFWKERLRSENINVVKKFDPQQVMVDVNIGQMNQVFFHLCQNAMQAMPEGGTLRIETEVLGSPIANQVEIRFCDSGMGISAENIGRLFDPFFTTQEVGKGKGLGLSFCHGIIREYGGQIFAQSDGVGQGSSIIIRLPIVSSVD